MRDIRRHGFIRWLSGLAALASALIAHESIVSSQRTAMSRLAGEPCGDPDAGSCFQEHASPGCNDADCCEFVCSIDPFCCDAVWDSLCAETAVEFCDGCLGPACELPAIECVNPSPQYDARSPVAQVLLAGFPFCTGFLVAAPNLLITSSDGVAMGDDPALVTVRFNVECDQCEGGALKATQEFAVQEILYTNTSLRISVLQLEGSPAMNWGIVTVDDRPPVRFASVYEIHHAALRNKGISSGFASSVHEPAQCFQGVASDFSVSAISAGGAWGAPVFDEATHAAIGMYYCGEDCEGGFAIPMSRAWSAILPVILNAGGSPSAYCPADTDNNGTVDVIDLLGILASWGECIAPCPPVCTNDVNFDCTVDVVDLLEVLGGWGACD